MKDAGFRGATGKTGVVQGMGELAYEERIKKDGTLSRERKRLERDEIIKVLGKVTADLVTTSHSTLTEKSRIPI